MMIHRNRTVLLFDLLLMMLFRFEYLVFLALLNWKQCYCKHTVLSTFESTELPFRRRTSTVKTLHIRSHLVDAKHGSLAKELSQKYNVTFNTVERYLTILSHEFLC